MFVLPHATIFQTPVSQNGIYEQLPSNADPIKWFDHTVKKNHNPFMNKQSAPWHLF
jgi:hypothetical protein